LLLRLLLLLLRLRLWQRYSLLLLRGHRHARETDGDECKRSKPFSHGKPLMLVDEGR
jgi:hypothetical protein